MDYALPRAEGMPDFRTRFDTSVPCLTNPLGAKGVGELGTIGATPAVMNAIADALAQAGARRGADDDPDAGDLGARLAGAAGRPVAGPRRGIEGGGGMDRRSPRCSGRWRATTRRATAGGGTVFGGAVQSAGHEAFALGPA